MHASIRELKAKLSEYLRRVAQGEEVYITAHGKVVARLAPAAATHDVAAIVSQLKQLPWLTPGKGEPLRGLNKGIALKGKGASAAELVLEDRE